MKLLVFLGNPGPRYARTRHNVGFLVAGELASRHGLAFRASSRTRGEVAELSAPPLRATLLRPTTFMNAAGDAVLPLAQFYRLGAEDLLVVQDDLDSPFGLVKVRAGGRHGGQNGVRDIIRVLGDDGFARLKVGIGRPPAGRDPADWVLSRWAADEEDTLRELVAVAASGAETWLREGLTAAQAQVNRTDLRPAPPAPTAEEEKRP